MTTTLWMIAGGIIALFVLSVVKGKRGHNLKFRVKQFGNNMVGIAVFVAILYMVIIAVYFTTILTKEIIEATPKFSEPTSIFVHKGVPFVFVALTILCIVWFSVKAFRVRLFRYTEEERKIINAEKQKNKEWLARVFRLRKRNG